MTLVQALVLFLLGCCVGIAPWHWLARKTHRLLSEIKAENAQAIEARQGQDPKGLDAKHESAVA